MTRSEVFEALESHLTAVVLRELTRMQKSSEVPFRVATGVLVETSGPWVLMGLPLGKLDLGGALVLGVSAEAPLAKAWLGAKPGDEVCMGPSTFLVKALH